MGVSGENERLGCIGYGSTIPRMGDSTFDQSLVESNQENIFTDAGSSFRRAITDEFFHRFLQCPAVHPSGEGTFE